MDTEVDLLPPINGGKVTCQECGQEFLRITRTHLARKHDMTPKEYQDKYGKTSTQPALLSRAELKGTEYAPTMLAGGPRNTLLNEDTHAHIMQLVIKGYPRSTIAKKVGISYATLLNWLKWGNMYDKDGNMLYPAMFYKFRQDYFEAEAISEMEAVDQVRGAGASEWRAALEFLARRFPDHWSPTSTQKLEGQVNVNHKQVKDVDVEKLLEDPETAEMACKLLEKLNATTDELVVELEDVDVEDVSEDAE